MARARKTRLTDVGVARLKPAASEYTVWDVRVPGLGVRVRPSGHRGYVYQCKVDGRAKRVTLGPAALKTVAEVRRECLEIEVTKKSGDRAMSARGKTPTFATFVAGPWKSACFERYKPATRKSVRGSLRTQLLPAFGDLPLDRIDRLRVHRWFDEYSRTAPGGANHIRMQSGDNRANERRAFRKMAKDMAGRYLRQMDMFNRRGLHRFGDLLSTTPQTMSDAKLRQLGQHIDDMQDRYGVSIDRRHNLERQTRDYLATTGGDGDDVRLGILSILIERYAKRVPQHSLFDEDIDDVEPTRPLTVDAGVADGARIHLLHKYDRPYYFGVDALCDAGSENAEQFLQLAARLVSQSETQLIRRGNDPVLPSDVQHKLLRERAGQLIREWDFPQCDIVRRLADGIANQCLAKSREGNASLGGGANAIGIPQNEFDSIPNSNPGLARVIKFGVAYNAFALVPNHRTKNRTWCLIELGGVLLLHHGLTLKRGGFLERRADDLMHLLRDG